MWGKERKKASNATIIKESYCRWVEDNELPAFLSQATDRKWH